MTALIYEKQATRPPNRGKRLPPVRLIAPSVLSEGTHTHLSPRPASPHHTAPLHSPTHQAVFPSSTTDPFSNLLSSHHSVTLTSGWRGHPRPPSSATHRLQLPAPSSKEPPSRHSRAAAGSPQPHSGEENLSFILDGRRDPTIQFLVNLGKVLRNSNAGSLQRDTHSQSLLHRAPPAAQKHPFAASRAPLRAGSSSLHPSARSSAPPSHLSPRSCSPRRGAGGNCPTPHSPRARLGLHLHRQDSTERRRAHLLPAAVGQRLRGRGRGRRASRGTRN